MALEIKAKKNCYKTNISLQSFYRRKILSQTFFTIIYEAKSFQELCIVDKILFSTFQATCIARGLLGDNQEKDSIF